MYGNELNIADRLEAATALLERALTWLEERQSALTGEVTKISATIEQSRRETELAEQLAAAEREISEMKATAANTSSIASRAQLTAPVAPVPPSAQRRTVPASTTEMLAKDGIGDGPADVRTLDAALTGLSLEQRIAVKSQLLRAGAIA